MKRKRKKENNDNFNTKIIKHNNDLPIYFFNNNTDIKTDSWFDIKINNTIIVFVLISIIYIILIYNFYLKIYYYNIIKCLIEY